VFTLYFVYVTKFRNKISCLQRVLQRQTTNKLNSIASFGIGNNINDDHICHMM